MMGALITPGTSSPEQRSLFALAILSENIYHVVQKLRLREPNCVDALSCQEPVGTPPDIMIPYAMPCSA